MRPDGDDELDDFIGFDAMMGADTVTCPKCGAKISCSLFFDDEVECPNCGGVGTWESDESSFRSAHYNKSHKCGSCDGTGVETLTRYAALDRDNDRLIAEKARLKRELNAAHARIVELTKALQDLRAGGDKPGAATPAVPVSTQGMASTLPDGFDSAHVGFGV